MTHNLGDWPSAIDAANHELALGNPHAYGDLFHGLGHAKRYREELNIIEAGLARDPRKFRVYVDGYLVAAAGRKQEGIDMAKAAVLAAANSSDLQALRTAYNDLGGVLVISGQADAAMAEYRHAIELGSSADDLGFDYGDALLATGEPKRALSFFETKIKEQPRVWDAHVGAARAYLALGDFAQANRLFALVAKESPLDPDMFLDWTRSLEAVGDAEGARRARLGADHATEMLAHPLPVSTAFQQTSGLRPTARTAAK